MGTHERPGRRGASRHFNPGRFSIGLLARVRQRSPPLAAAGRSRAGTRPTGGEIQSAFHARSHDDQTSTTAVLFPSPTGPSTEAPQAAISINSKPGGRTYKHVRRARTRASSHVGEGPGRLTRGRRSGERSRSTRKTRASHSRLPNSGLDLKPGGRGSSPPNQDLRPDAADLGKQRVPARDRIKLHARIKLPRGRAASRRTSSGDSEQGGSPQPQR